jgi:hypothetical protein
MSVKNGVDGVFYITKDLQSSQHVIKFFQSWQATKFMAKSLNVTKFILFKPYT